LNYFQTLKGIKMDLQAVGEVGDLVGPPPTVLRAQCLPRTQKENGLEAFPFTQAVMVLFLSLSIIDTVKGFCFAYNFQGEGFPSVHFKGLFLLS
jgi:hypothetical protein